MGKPVYPWEKQQQQHLVERRENPLQDSSTAIFFFLSFFGFLAVILVSDFILFFNDFYFIYIKKFIGACHQNIGPGTHVVC